MVKQAVRGQPPIADRHLFVGRLFILKPVMVAATVKIARRNRPEYEARADDAPHAITDRPLIFDPRRDRGHDLARRLRFFRASAYPFSVARGPILKHEGAGVGIRNRSEEHTSELQSIMRISYAVICLKK